jgi:hypothetical protein
MSDDGWGICAPAFKPDEALATLGRVLRDLKLSERGNGFELRGKRVLELSVEGSMLQAKLARRLMLTPEWDRITVASSHEQRKLVDEVKKRLARWQDEE